MPAALFGLAAGAINGKLYAIGGSETSPAYPPFADAVEAYDPATNTWTARAALPSARWGPAVAVMDGKLYAIGGEDDSGNAVNTVDVYDPVTNAWTARAPMPTTHALLGAAVVHHVLYAVGGASETFSGYAATNVVEAYNPSTNTWTTKAPMPTSRVALSAQAVNGILYAIGGFGGISSFDTVEAYDPATNTWTEKAPMAQVRSYVGTAVIRDTIYAVGGFGRTSLGDLSLSSVEAYNAATNTWTAKASLQTARRGLAIAVLRDRLYAMGGIGNSFDNVLNSVEVYTP